MNKCIWCYKQNERIKEVTVSTKGLIWVPLQNGKAFVCPEHEEKFRKFHDHSRRYGILFIGLNAILVLCLLVSAFGLGSNNNYWALYLFIGSFAAIGVVIFIFPFCSPSTFDLMSIAKSIKLARAIGVVIFALGTAGLTFALLYW